MDTNGCDVLKTLETSLKAPLWVYLLCLASALVVIYDVWRKLEVYGIKAFLNHVVLKLVALMLFAITLYVLLPKHDFEEYEFIAEALIVVAFIGVILELTHIGEAFERFVEAALKRAMKLPCDLAGEWTYEVSELSGRPRHRGTCKVNNQKPLSISGERTEVRDEKATNYIPTPWYTSFAVLVPEDKPESLYFAYKILEKDKWVEGFCHLNVPPGKPSELYGEYKQLGEGIAEGSIRFQKVDKKALSADAPATGVRQCLLKLLHRQ